MTAPRKLTAKKDRALARRIRDFHWQIMERIAREGTLYICLWNKHRMEERPDEVLLCLISGNELIDWMHRHRDWFLIGPQNKERWTNPVSLTAAGIRALAEREKYDMEPVHGGLIEPGWQAVPSPPAKPATSAGPA